MLATLTFGCWKCLCNPIFELDGTLQPQNRIYSGFNSVQNSFIYYHSIFV
ncbi:hypothetical protein XBI1_70002 [Xenorhabdus bovienii str. Intermedium]|uniref:Uncharacterized protein n=1 Tax=Xenorhabdus bovienii str. Intermedium TaxID=1379677 RepID=A0A077QQV2_XENBV|nr:hypothetical protein XBI1_70002 [Xenorhabdus bovienii str. Intermedium]